jgi:hypothetical protein
MDSPAPPAGKRINLKSGSLYVPADFHPSKDGVEITMHLHGGADVAEREWRKAKREGVVVSITIPGLSSVYAKAFHDPKTLPNLLAEVQSHLATDGKKPAIKRMTVSSFSAGYGGVREMLRDAACFDRIDAIVLADSLYCGYVDDAKSKGLRADQMEPFAKFAKEAAAGRKTFIVSHCQLQPPTYAGTAETADYLITAVQGKRETNRTPWSVAAYSPETFCRVGKFQLYGFAGTTGPDHVQHLRHLGDLLKLQ